MGKTEHIAIPWARLSTRSILLGFSFAFWLSSLAFPALISPNSEHTLSGLSILVIGWLGFAGVEDGVNLLGVLAWWANPFYLWAIFRASFGKVVPVTSTYLAVAIASLTVLLSSYALNAVPTFTPVIGYGPGALLWFLSILGLAYVVTKDAENLLGSNTVMVITALIITTFLVQVGWRAIASNDSEKDRLPHHSAKRGVICSVTSPPLPITEKEPAIELKADSKYWLESLLHWGVSAVQVEGIEYRRAPKGAPESQQPPYMVTSPISVPARYTLRAEGGYPFINKWSDGGDFVRLSLVDNKENKKLGQIVYRREINRRLDFCPSLTQYPKSRREEAIKWLAPFINEETSQ